MVQASMTPAAMSPMALHAHLAGKPGLLPVNTRAYVSSRGRCGDEWRLPLAVSLSAMVLVSVGLWSGIWMAVRTLL
jgi:hypothetical protein